MIKEARGFGNTIDEAKENAIKELNASEFDDVQIDIVKDLINSLTKYFKNQAKKMLEIANVVIAGTNTIVMPEAMPGVERGRTTLVTTRMEPAPRSCAASMVRSSILVITE